MDAALKQLGANRAFSNLSLREVTRDAGIAPTSFYRHFDEMNELGLALVDEAGVIRYAHVEALASRRSRPTSSR